MTGAVRNRPKGTDGAYHYGTSYPVPSFKGKWPAYTIPATLTSRRRDGGSLFAVASLGDCVVCGEPIKPSQGFAGRTTSPWWKITHCYACATLTDTEGTTA